MTEQRDISSQLVAAEPINLARREELQAQIRSTFEQVLTPLKRRLLIATGICCSLIMPSGLLLRMLVKREPLSQILDFGLVNLVAIVAGVGCAALGIMCIVIGVRGVFDRRKHNHWLIAISVALAGGIGLVFLNQGFGAMDGQFIFVGAVMLVIVMVTILMHCIEQNQLATRQKMLELEYRIAAISEKPGQDRAGDNS